MFKEDKVEGEDTDDQARNTNLSKVVRSVTRDFTAGGKEMSVRKINSEQQRAELGDTN